MVEQGRNASPSPRVSGGRRQWLGKSVTPPPLHLSTPPPWPAQYLGPKAQLVDGVLGLGILGEELVVVLLREGGQRGHTPGL